MRFDNSAGVQSVENSWVKKTKLLLLGTLSGHGSISHVSCQKLPLSIGHETQNLGGKDLNYTFLCRVIITYFCHFI